MGLLFHIWIPVPDLTWFRQNYYSWALSKPKNGILYIQYMSAIFDFKALHQFETHVNGFLEPESPNFHPNHAFLTSIKAEIITFLPQKVVILFFLLLRTSYRYFNVARLSQFIVRPQRHFILKMVLLTVILLTDPTITLMWYLSKYKKESSITPVWWGLYMYVFVFEATCRDGVHDKYSFNLLTCLDTEECPQSCR